MIAHFIATLLVYVLNYTLGLGSIIITPFVMVLKLFNFGDYLIGDFILYLTSFPLKPVLYIIVLIFGGMINVLRPGFKYDFHFGVIEVHIEYKDWSK